MQTPEGKKVAAQLSAALTELADLSKISDLDAAMLWNQLVAHIRSARPQALLSLKDVL